MAEEYKGADKRHLPRNPVGDLSYQRFGHSTRQKTSSGTVGTTAAPILKANPNRLALIIHNNSASDFYVSFEPDVSSSKGFLVSANGGDFRAKFEDYGEAVTDDLYAVSGSAGLSATMLEVVTHGRY